jgi:dihydropyrimidinase
MARADLRLAGGQVVLPESGLVEADILILGGRIAGLVDPAAGAEADAVVEIRGLTVLPGVVDGHVHLGQDITFPKTAEDVRKETAAAAAGGVSTLIAYLMTAQPYDEVFQGVVERMQADGLIDFGLHFCISTREQLASVPHYVSELGVSSFKFFMNFRDGEGAYLGLPDIDDSFLFDLMSAAAKHGATVNPHGENVEIIRGIRNAPQPENLSDLAMWNFLRPAFVEAEAQQRAAYFARVTGASMYAVHVTNAECLDALVRQRSAYDGIFLETCPHYLTHDVESELGTLAKVNPPLRRPEDREVLWRAVADGTIDVVGSDHVPRNVTAKTAPLAKASAGFPGLETLLPILLSEGHLKRGIPLARIAEVTSAAPARIFGLTGKGRIAVGADADLAIVDLVGRHTIEAATQQSGAGYTIYEGWEVGAKVVHTLVRGEFALRDGSIVGKPLGRFQARKRSGLAAGKEGA